MPYLRVKCGKCGEIVPIDSEIRKGLCKACGAKIAIAGASKPSCETPISAPVAQKSEISKEFPLSLKGVDADRQTGDLSELNPSPLRGTPFKERENFLDADKNFSAKSDDVIQKKPISKPAAMTKTEEDSKVAELMASIGKILSGKDEPSAASSDDDGFAGLMAMFTQIMKE